MGGLRHTAFDTIEDLRRNLRDRYKDCHAVLKELIQNADDAGATELHIVWLPSITNAQHPLLLGPILVVLNNAPFTFLDSYSIHLAGTGSKGHEDGKIGKFGLGLKSVFHLCEAFFYFSDPSGDAEPVNEALKEFGRTGILNPWHGERYAEWDSFVEHDRELLRKLVTRYLGDGMTDWFGLCLPLRRRTHCQISAEDNPAQWAIEPKYYGDSPKPPEDIFAERRLAGIQPILPLMSTLEAVRFWSSDSNSAVPRTVSRETREHVDWRVMAQGRAGLAGSVKLVTDGSTNKQLYAGIHELLSHDALSQLEREEEWPHTDSQTSAGRERKPAVARQHAGVVVIEQPGAGFLRVDRAVFLPLGDPPHPECKGDSGHAFDLILHGYFFVDAGRLGVDFAPDGERPTVRQKWNQTLYEQGTLPLLIPALSQYANAISSDAQRLDKLHDLTDLVVRHRLWDEHKSQICRDVSWLYRLDDRGGRWCVLPQKTLIVYLPGDRETDPRLPFDVFPALGSQPGNRAFSFCKLPRLVQRTEESWPDDLVSQLLQSVPTCDVVGDSTKLTYLLTTAIEFRDRHAPHFVESLLQLMRSVLRDTRLRELRAQGDTMSALLELLPTSAVLPIPFKSDLVRESERLFEALVAEDTEILPVPNVLVETGATNGPEIGTADARSLLAALAAHRPSGTQEDAFHALVGQTAIAILHSWAPGAAELKAEFGDLPIFYARDYSNDSRAALSANQLHTSQLAGLLFCKSASFCKRLQACLQAGTVVFIGQLDVARFLSDALGVIPACDADACATVLANGARLVTTVEPRAELVRGLLPTSTEGASQVLRRALRYLLHRDSTRIDDTSTLLIEGTDGWSALASAILAATGDSWRLIPDSLTLDLARSHTALLDLVECSRATIPALTEHDADAVVDCATVLRNPAWVEQIVREWPDSDLDSLRALPLFLRSDGVAIAITDETFIQGDLPLPPSSVFPNLVLIHDPSGAIRDRSLAPTLSPTDVLRKALALDDCHLHWRFILESIPFDVPENLRRELRNRRWLPGPNGSAFAPSEIICRGHITGSIRELRGADRRVLPKDDLPTSITNHVRWSDIEPMCPRGEELYRRLGEALRGVPRFAVGIHTVNEANLSDFIDLFAESPSVMPAASLFSQLRDSGTGGVQWIARHLLPAVQAPLPHDRVRDVFSHIASRHKCSSSAMRRQCLELFNSFLREVSCGSDSREILSEIQLLNRESGWCAASQLAVSGYNVADSHLLHRSHVDVLQHILADEGNQSRESDRLRDRAIGGRTFDQDELAASAGVLGKYLESWRGEDVPDDAIAAVVAMLGNNDGYPDLYETLRDSRSLAALRNLFSWQKAVTGWWGLGELMDRQHFLIVPADAKTVEATNLLGQRFSAAVSSQLVSLFDGFDGREYYPLPQDHRCYVIRLRQIDPEDLTTDQKLEILGCTIQAIRSLIHRQSNDEFPSIWSQVTHVGQLDIESAQNLILESSAMLLETQLSVRHASALRNVFNAWHRIRQQRQTASTDDERQLADTERTKVLEELRSLLVDDHDTQRLLITEICKRLDAASYDKASIPFELFQNGDDAVVELESLCENDDVLLRARPAELRCRFTAETDSIDGQPVLRFIHWGRAINQFRVGSSDGRDRGFDRDMERMLVLQGSGKGDEDGDGERTGKFGLGFKSVFFVSDSPHVLSGSRSRFCVFGGVYPNRLSDSDEERLEAILSDLGDARHRGTVIELPLRDAVDATSVLERFRKLAGYSVVFARRLRQCTVGLAGKPDFACHWSPTEVAPRVEIGTVKSTEGGTNPVMVFRLGPDRYGAILLATDDHGISPDHLHGLPEVWVTTPTEHHGAGGVLVNGDFDVNPGRTQLRKTEKNEQLALEMGHEFGDQLCKLHKACESDWTTMRSALGCKVATLDEFWTSLWRICAPHASSDFKHGVIQRILFGSEYCGILRLIRDAEAMPTDLHGRYGCLTSIQKITWCTRGILEDADVWEAAANGRWISDNVQPGEAIASSIGSVLDRVSSITVPSLTLADVLVKTIADGPSVSPKVANDLGTFITPERLREMGSNRNWAKEERQIRESVSELKFRSESGVWSPAAHLLISDAPPSRVEERRRAAFAPLGCLLSRDYEGKGVQFFLACRKEMQASAEQMAQWLLDASEASQRKAGLEYLEQGELSYQMQRALSERTTEVEESWLGDPEERDEAIPDDPNRQAVIMGKLHLGAEFIKERTGHLTPAPEVPKSLRPPRDVLADVVKWWRREKETILACHDDRVFPGGRSPAISFSATADQLARDVAIRREWMILFMRGAMHRFGRVTDYQNRDFLHLCIGRGWLDILSGPPDSPSRWFDVMDDYLDSLQGDAKYFQWMNQFLAFYQLARWLPKYVRAFEAVTRPGVNLHNLNSIGDIANLRTSHVFAGSTGFDAPPCSRTLGLGSHFVLREVLRARLQDESGGYSASLPLMEMAYVPSLGLRRILACITGKRELLDDKTPRAVQSKRIANLLSEYVGSDASFDGYFDIPLLSLTWPKFRSVRDDLLGGDGPWGDDNMDDFLEEPPPEEGED